MIYCQCQVGRAVDECTIEIKEYDLFIAKFQIMNLMYIILSVKDITPVEYDLLIILINNFSKTFSFSIPITGVIFTPTPINTKICLVFMFLHGI